jgi:hypothetical protein
MRGVDAYYPVALQYEAGHQGFKMDLTAAVDDGVSDILNYARQAVRTYVGVGIGQYRGACAVLAEYVQYAVCAAAFLASGVQFAVGVGTGTALAKTVVGFRVDLMGTAYGGYVNLAVMHVLAALKDNRSKSKFNKVQRCEQTSGACAYHYDCGLAVNWTVVYPGKLVLGRLLINENPQSEVYENGALAGIDALLERADSRYGAHVKSALP